jgi:hypothetical protein
VTVVVEGVMLLRHVQLRPWCSRLRPLDDAMRPVDSDRLVGRCQEVFGSASRDEGGAGRREMSARRTCRDDFALFVESGVLDAPARRLDAVFGRRHHGNTDNTRDLGAN